VGVTILKHLGEEVKRGEAWLRVHHSTINLDEGLSKKLQDSLKLVKNKPTVASRIIKIMG